MAGNSYIRPSLFRFFEELKENNTREWFAENKTRYENEVRDPLLRFIEDFAPHLESISPHVHADARRQGGSLFRLHRDVRFSADKRPFKEHAGVQFRHAEGRDVHAPGYYLHLAPGEIFAAAGIWHPDSETLRNIRRTLAENPTEWQEVLENPALKRQWTLERSNALKRPPQGIEPDHPIVDDLKLKDFVLVCGLKRKDVEAPKFLAQYAGLCRSAAPFMAFLARALAMPW